MGTLKLDAVGGFCDISLCSFLLLLSKPNKDSYVVILKRRDNINKLETMINKVIESGTFAKCEDTKLNDFKLFQEFLRQNLKNFEKYDKIRTVANQPGKLFATAKTLQFNNIENINAEEFKFRPIIDQTGTFTYNCSKVIAEYLKPLYHS